MSIAFYIDLATIYPVYLLGGYMIADRQLDIDRFALPMLLAGSGGIITASILCYRGGLQFMDSFLGYSSPFTFMAAIGLFRLIMRNNTYGEKLTLMTLIADKASFGIYLIHVVLLRLMLRYWAYCPYTGNALSMINVLMVAVVAFIFSMAIYYLWNQIWGLLQKSSKRKENYNG